MSCFHGSQDTILWAIVRCPGRQPADDMVTTYSPAGMREFIR